jgi:signal transduction histidine kinase
MRGVVRRVQEWLRSLLARFFLPTALILIVCVGAIGLLTYHHTESAFGSYVTARQGQALTTRGRLLALAISVLHRREGDWRGTQGLVQEEDANGDTRLLVMDNTGTIVADSSNLAIGQHFVRTANTIVVPIRHRLVLGKIGSLALIPVAENQAAQQAFLSSVDTGLFLVVLCALAAALALTYWNVRRVTRPLSAMTSAATHLAGGDLTQRVPVSVAGSEVAALAQAFNAMAASLEDARRQRSALTADIAHELRTPLTSVRGYLEAIQDGAIAASPPVIDSIHEEVVQLGALVGDLQDLALADAGQLALQRQTQRIDPLLQQAVAMQEVTAHRRGVALRYQPPAAPLPPLAVDTLRLGQVLRNLIANALAHTPPGGSVTVSAAGTATGVEIGVRDTGEGIAPEHLPHIFDRFYRADPSRSRATGGAGIGLSVARGIVQAHGGAIEVQSSVGQGAEFRIILPV